MLLSELDSALIGAFLQHLEEERGNSPRTRNSRLAAIRSFFKYVAPLEPAHSGQIQRVLAIPTKRCAKNVVCYLTRTEAKALLAAPDQATVTAMQQGRFADATAALMAKRKTGVWDLEDQMMLAAACLGAKDYACAEHLYNETLQPTPRTALAYYGLGVVAQMRGQRSRATQYFQAYLNSTCRGASPRTMPWPATTSRTRPERRHVDLSWVRRRVWRSCPTFRFVGQAWGSSPLC